MTKNLSSPKQTAETLGALLVHQLFAAVLVVIPYP